MSFTEQDSPKPAMFMVVVVGVVVMQWWWWWWFCIKLVRVFVDRNHFWLFPSQIIIYPCTWTLLNVLAVNRHFQGVVSTKQ